MDFNKNFKEWLEQLFENVNEGFILYDAAQKSVLMLNNKAKENFCLDRYKSCTKNKAKAIIEKLITDRSIIEKEVRNEIYCDITKTQKLTHIKIIPTNLHHIYIIKSEDITHLKETETAIDKLSPIFNEENLLVALINIDGNFEFANKKFLETFGYNMTEIIGKNLFSFNINKDDKQKIKTWKTISSGENWQGEIITNNTKGYEIVLRTSIEPYKNNNHIEKFVLKAEDITQKKVFEEEIQKAEIKNEIILNTLPDTIFVLNKEAYLTDFRNAPNYQILDETHPIGKKITEIGMPDALSKKISNALNFAIKSKKIKNFIYEYKHTELIIECRLVALSDNEALCIVRDITKRVLGERYLKNREKSYKSMVENFPSGVIIHKNNQIVYANKIAIKYLGAKNLKELRKYNIFELIPYKHRTLSRERVQRASKGEEVEFMEFPLRRINDSKIVYYETKPVLFDYYGEQVCQIVIRDLSVQKRLMKESIRAQIAEKNNVEYRKEVRMRKNIEKNLVKSLKEKELLIKEIHHRVKNNMQIISSIINLQSNYITNPSAKRMFEDTQSRIKSMALVHEQIYTGTEFTYISFKNYFDSISDSILRSHENNSLKIKLTKKIKDFQLPVTHSVPTGLIINEILGLSIKRLFVEKSKKSCIFVEANLKNNEVKIEVTDNAKPIIDRKEYDEKYSLSNLLINALVEQLNGTIDIDSKEETSFKIKFNI